MILKFISLPIFLLSFCIGILFVYLSPPQHTTIHVYPTPDNVEIIEYYDKAGTCHQYTFSEVECNNTNTKNIPIQN
tara:strand:+ start:7793 stop:8020 length:228 start_codon:yes stop_codon:yes gene_type:complete